VSVDFSYIENLFQKIFKKKLKIKKNPKGGFYWVFLGGCFGGFFLLPTLHVGQAVRVPHVRQALPQIKLPARASEAPPGAGHLRLSHVRQTVLLAEQAEGAHSHAHRRGTYLQGCGSGLDPDSIGSVDPDPGGQK
jgi:hypothetical protein